MSYAFAAGSVYAHSPEGQKVEMIRRSPEVCFEVDHVEDLVNWHSVIGWGTYEELQGAQAERARSVLRERLRACLPRVLDHGALPADEPSSPKQPVLYRLNLAHLTGRESRLYWGLLQAVDEQSRAEPSLA